MWVKEGGLFSLMAPFQRVRLNTSLESTYELFLDSSAREMRVWEKVRVSNYDCERDEEIRERNRVFVEKI